MADPVRLIWSERKALSGSARIFLACMRRHIKDESLETAVSAAS
jgi:hypothetical protein